MSRKLFFWPAIALALVLLLAACGGGDQPATVGEDGASEPIAAEEESQVVAAGDPQAGEELFQASCSACHGADAKGLPGLGKDLTSGTFITEQSDEELLAFIKVGRPSSDPANTTGIDMPPKGGNPALTDEQILDIIAHLRAIHE